MNRLRRLAVAMAALALGTTGCARGCTKGNGPEVIGPTGPVDEVDFTPYLALAHAIVTHARPPVGECPRRQGQRVFVTAWAPGQPPVRATGLGVRLEDSVRIAAEEVAKTAKGEARVEIDVLTSAENASLDAKMRERVFDVGLNGYLASEGPERVGWVLPSEIIDERYADLAEKNQSVELHGDKLMATLATRAKVDVTEMGRMNVSRFRVTERIEAAAGPASPPLALFRRMPAHPATLTPDALVTAVRAGADYLARVIDDKGAFIYEYDPIADQRKRGYGLLRHAGSLYAMMEAYEELRDPAWLDKARLAIAFMKSKMKPTPDGSYLIDNADEEQQKVGGNGLALIALVKYAEASGDTSDLPTMRELARLIVHQQYPDGHFRDNADVSREDESLHGKKLKKEVPYFPGEASLGLVRLYGIDPQPHWLAAARKGIDFLIHVRDAHDDLKTQNHDHWQSYALHDLYVLTKEQAYLDQAVKISRAILLGEKKDATAPYPDYVGAFYDEGETTPTSTRLEALASTMQLSRFAGADDAWIAPTAMQLACFMRGQQLDAENDFFVKNPAKAVGGVRESLVNSDVRIDYPQHAMSGWLRLARLLRDPQYGKGPK